MLNITLHKNLTIKRGNNSVIEEMFNNIIL